MMCFRLFRLLFCLLLFVWHPLFAVDLELTEGVTQRLPIALVPFEQPEGLVFSQIINDDLSHTGEFRWVPYDASQASHRYVDVNFNYWRSAGVNNLVIGTVRSVTNGDYSVRVELIDPLSESHLLLSREYRAKPSHMRALAHHISDLIYQQLTGVRGIFSTRMAYIVVDRSQSVQSPSYRLDISDYDGGQAQTLLISDQPIMSPSWSHNGQSIAYVSFENKKAEIFIVDIHTGKRERMTSFPGINGAPNWSPDDKKLALVLSKSGTPKIYLYTRDNRQLKQLTTGDAIDTEPTFSEDGSRLLFTSNRGGSPQIYEMELESGKTKRLSYQGSYNASGEYISSRQLVVLHKKGSSFSIGLLDTHHGQVSSLTVSPHDESPSLSPNRKMVVFATQKQGQRILSVVTLNGETEFNFPAPLSNQDMQEPAWSPYF